jgi:hypothetical protein
VKPKFRPLDPLAFLLLLFLSPAAFAGAPETSMEGIDSLMKSGQAGQAAEQYYAAYKANPRGKDAALYLIKTGRALDAAKLKFYEEADGKCYLGKKSERQARPECFEADVADLNRRYGEGSFTYHGDQVQYVYNATHFKRVLEEFSGSPYEDEASLALLRGRALVSDDPDYGIQKVEDWLEKYPKSVLRPRALLLSGRLYADAFVVMKPGGFVLINGKVDREGVSLRRSKYQAKGLAGFQEVFEKYGSSPEASAARREYDILKSGKDDGIFYGVSY